MNSAVKERAQSLVTARQHPAWQLLAHRRAPLIISCLKPLFEPKQGGISLEDAQQRLAEILAAHANDDTFEIVSQNEDGRDDYGPQARRDLRSWIKRGLIIERSGNLAATDALQQVFQFTEGLAEERVMTSTASRLATVQREIERLEMHLNPDAESRAESLRGKIEDLEAELARVEAGDVSVLEGAQAVEGIREVYTLAAGLRADFRRVEDSYRAADLALRHAIINEQHDRGEIVERLLSAHESLLETPEGSVFHSFYEQLDRSTQLEQMERRLKIMLQHPAAKQALSYKQQADLRWLVPNLVDESHSVLRVRAKSEGDVRGFLKTGLAAEYHRVAQLLNDIFSAATKVDWASASVRRTPAPLPPIGMALRNVPLIQRLRFKALEDNSAPALDLDERSANLDELADDFWEAFDTLDRRALIRSTLNVLNGANEPMSLRDLYDHLHASIAAAHVLEALTLWLSMAREAEVSMHAGEETIDIIQEDSQNGGQRPVPNARLRFHVPKVTLSAAALQTIDWELW